MNSYGSENNMPGGHTRKNSHSGESLELLNTLEVKTVQRKHGEKIDY
jgi:hypothetical protein